MSRSKRRAYRQSYYADYCQDTRPTRRKLPNSREYRTRYGAIAAMRDLKLDSATLATGEVIDR